MVSFKNLYDTYIKSNNYGKYSKIEYHEKVFDPNLYFRYSGKIYKKCQRKWRFRKPILHF